MVGSGLLTLSPDVNLDRFISLSPPAKLGNVYSSNGGFKNSPLAGSMLDTSTPLVNMAKQLRLLVTPVTATPVQIADVIQVGASSAAAAAVGPTSSVVSEVFGAPSGNGAEGATDGGGAAGGASGGAGD